MANNPEDLDFETTPTLADIQKGAYRSGYKKANEPLGPGIPTSTPLDMRQFEPTQGGPKNWQEISIEDLIKSGKPVGQDTKMYDELGQAQEGKPHPAVDVLRQMDASKAMAQTATDPTAQELAAANANILALINPPPRSNYGDTPQGYLTTLVTDRSNTFGEGLSKIRSMYENGDEYVRGLPGIDEFVSKIPSGLVTAATAAARGTVEPWLRGMNKLGDVLNFGQIVDVDKEKALAEEVNPNPWSAWAGEFVPQAAYWTALESVGMPVIAGALGRVGKVAEVVNRLRNAGPMTTAMKDLAAGGVKWERRLAKAASMASAYVGSELMYGKDPSLEGLAGVEAGGFVLGKLADVLYFKEGAIGKGLRYLADASGMEPAEISRHVKGVDKLVESIKATSTDENRTAVDGLINRIVLQGGKEYGAPFGRWFGRWAARGEMSPEDFDTVLADHTNQDFIRAAREHYTHANVSLAVLRNMKESFGGSVNFLRELGATDDFIESISHSKQAFQEGASRWYGRFVAHSGEDPDLLDMLLKSHPGPKYYNMAVDEYNQALKDLGREFTPPLSKRAEFFKPPAGREFKYTQDHLIVDVNAKMSGGAEKYYPPLSRWHLDRSKVGPVNIQSRTFGNPVEVHLQDGELLADAAVSRIKGDPKISAAIANIINNRLVRYTTLPASTANDIVEGLSNRMAKRAGYDSIIYKGTSPEKNVYVDLRNLKPLEGTAQQILERFEKDLAKEGQRTMGRNFLSIAGPVFAGVSAYELMNPKRSEAAPINFAELRAFSTLGEKAWQFVTRFMESGEGGRGARYALDYALEKFGMDLPVEQFINKLEATHEILKMPWEPIITSEISPGGFRIVSVDHPTVGEVGNVIYDTTHLRKDAPLNNLIISGIGPDAVGPSVIKKTLRYIKQLPEYSGIRDYDRITGVAEKSKEGFRTARLKSLVLPAVGIGLGAMLPQDQAEAMDFEPIVKLASKFANVEELIDAVEPQVGALIKQASHLSGETNPGKVVSFLGKVQNDVHTMSPPARIVNYDSGPDYVGFHVQHDDLGPFPVANIRGVVDPESGTWYPQVTASPLGFTRKALSKVFDQARLLTQSGENAQAYHGTMGGFDKLSGEEGERALYGPGAYVTSSPEVASGYAKPKPGMSKQMLETVGSNVRPVQVKPGKYLDMDGPPDPTLVKFLMEDTSGIDYAVKEIPGSGGRFGNEPVAETNRELYKDLVEHYGDTYSARDVLEEMGFDGITHMGGNKPEAVKHKVWVVFDPEKSLVEGKVSKRPLITAFKNPRSLAGLVAATYLLKDFVWPKGEAHGIEPPIEPLAEMMGKAGMRGVADDFVEQMAKSSTVDDIMNATMTRVKAASRKAAPRSEGESVSGAAFRNWDSLTNMDEGAANQFMAMMHSGEGLNSAFQLRPWWSLSDNPMWQGPYGYFVADKEGTFIGKGSVNEIAKDNATALLKQLPRGEADEPELYDAIHGMRTSRTGAPVQTIARISDPINAIAKRYHKEIVDPLDYMENGVDPRVYSILDEFKLDDTPETLRHLKALQLRKDTDPMPPGTTAAHQSAAQLTNGWLNWHPNLGPPDVPYVDRKFVIAPVKQEREALTGLIKHFNMLHGNNPPDDVKQQMQPLLARMLQLDRMEQELKNPTGPGIAYHTLPSREKVRNYAARSIPEQTQLKAFKDTPGIWGYRGLASRHIDDKLTNIFFNKHLPIFKRTAEFIANNPNQPDKALAQQMTFFMNSMRGLKAMKEDAGLVQFANAFARHLPGGEKRVTEEDVRRAASAVMNFEWLTKLGFGLRFPIKNSTQIPLTLYPVVGEASTLRGYAKAMTDEAIWKEAELGKVLRYESGMRAEVDPSKLTAIVDWLPNKSENFNRVVAYAAAKDYALSELAKGTFKPQHFVRTFDRNVLSTGNHELIAKEYARGVVRATQFLFGPEGRPPIFTGGALRRVMTQFKTFGAAYADLMAGFVKHGQMTGDWAPITRASTALLMIGGPAVVATGAGYEMVRRELLKRGHDWLPMSGSGIGYLASVASSTFMEPDTADKVKQGINWLQMSQGFDNPLLFLMGGGGGGDLNAQFAQSLLGPTLGGAAQTAKVGGDWLRGARGVGGRPVSGADVARQAVGSLGSPLVPSVLDAAQAWGGWPLLNEWLSNMGYRGGIYSDAGKQIAQRPGPLSLFARAFNLQPSWRQQRYTYQKSIQTALEGGNMAAAEKYMHEAEIMGFNFTPQDLRKMKSTTKSENKSTPNLPLR